MERAAQRRSRDGGDEGTWAQRRLVAGGSQHQLIAAAYESRSLVVTSNWPFEQWTNFLPDAATAILNHCEVTVVSGDSFLTN